jgi:prepilin-type N-terminal cleavage/methylation domain-containing protein
MCTSGTVRRRHGYTLLELLIVLAILAMVVGLAWPSVHRLSQKGQLQDAARQLRIQLLEARLDAIQSGSVRLFRYQPGTSSYEVSSGGDLDTVDQLGLVTPGDAANDDGPLSRGVNGDASSQRELPDDIVFFDPDAGPAVEFAGDLAGGGADQAWSVPIVFYPNGRTLNARLRLGTPRYAVDLSLRGLTGTVTVGEVQRLETADGERLEDL